MDSSVPYRVGDIVSMTGPFGADSGAFDGILWRVVMIKEITKHAHNLRIEFCWCATGSSSLRPKWIAASRVKQRFDFVRLGQLRMQLDDLCRQALNREVDPIPFG